MKFHPACTQRKRSKTCGVCEHSWKQTGRRKKRKRKKSLGSQQIFQGLDDSFQLNLGLFPELAVHHARIAGGGWGRGACQEDIPLPISINPEENKGSCFPACTSAAFHIRAAAPMETSESVPQYSSLIISCSVTERSQCFSFFLIAFTFCEKSGRKRVKAAFNYNKHLFLLTFIETICLLPPL